MSTVASARCDCGWSGRYPTQGRAAVALARHSCERTARLRADVTRATAREAAIDRTPKPCTHPRANHEHGTYTTYTLDACRCLPCSAACSKYNADTARAKAYGTWNGLVDASPVRAHVEQLREAGLGVKRIAAQSGITASALGKLVYGFQGRPPSKRVKEYTARNILAVPLPTVHDLGDPTTVDGTGTRRRLEALMALGWSVNRLCQDHGIDRQALDRALCGAPVAAVTARRVRAMYDAVGDTPPPETTRTERQSAVRSRNLAAKRGWVIPAEWDEADLDDPYAAPPAGADTTGRAVLDVEEWAHLVRGGEAPDRAAQRCGVTISAVEAVIKRDARADLRQLLHQARTAAA